MVDTDGELIAPGSFLPIAEQFGLMGEIDRWVARRAIEAIAANPDRDLVFEINLSGQLARLAGAAGGDPRRDGDRRRRPGA